MTTIVQAKVTFYFNGNINDFLGLFDLYDGSVTGVFQQEANHLDVNVTEVTQDDCLDIESLIQYDETIDKIWYKED